jgi:hypothetical protein
MHVSWYHAKDTRYVQDLVKLEDRLSISVLRTKSFFTKKKKLSHPFGKCFVSLFSPELNGQPAFKFDRVLDVLCIYCMISRMPVFLG